MQNSVVEELPEESPLASGDQAAGGNKARTSPFVSPIKQASSSPASPLLIQTLSKNVATPESLGFSLDLSRITERTERTDEGENQSSVEASQSTVGISDTSWAPSEQVPPGKKLDFESSVGGTTGSFYQSSRFGGGGSTTRNPKQRSVFSILFGCLFPFCRF